MNYSASQLVNFESIRRMILRGVGGETDTVTVHTVREIKRKRGNGRVQIVTEPEDKAYRVSFFKRRRLHDNTSVPFGYTGYTRRKGPNFGRVFLRSNYTDITQNTYIQSSMVTEILNIEK